MAASRAAEQNCYVFDTTCRKFQTACLLPLLAERGEGRGEKLKNKLLLRIGREKATDLSRQNPMKAAGRIRCPLTLTLSPFGRGEGNKFPRSDVMKAQITNHVRLPLLAKRGEGRGEEQK
jgi:hypothetical protein